MARAKRHLLVRGQRVACGLQNPSLTTSDPRKVTCKKCSKTLHMADAEVKAHLGSAVRGQEQPPTNRFSD